MSKIGFIKNGNGIEQYLLVRNDYKDNSIELIWDINDILRTHKVLLISFADANKTFVDSSAGITLYDLKSTHKNGLISFIIKLTIILKIIKILVKEKPNYIVVSNFQFLFIYLLIYRLLGLRVILNFSRAEHLNSRTAFLIKKFKVNSLIAPGTMAQTITDKYGLKAYMRIPKYPASFFSNIPCPDLPQHKFTVAFIGRLIKAKGIYEFIYAAMEIAKKYNEIGFLIIGNGPEKEMIINIISQADLKNKITLLGYKNNIEIGAYLRKINAIVVPSYTEGFSKVWYEAILTATPIILTRHSGIDKLIIEQEHGLYIQTKSKVDIVTKVLELYENDNLYSSLRRNLKSLRDTDKLRSKHNLSEVIQLIVENQDLNEY